MLEIQTKKPFDANKSAYIEQLIRIVSCFVGIIHKLVHNIGSNGAAESKVRIIQSK